MSIPEEIANRRERKERLRSVIAHSVDTLTNLLGHVVEAGDLRRAP